MPIPSSMKRHHGPAKHDAAVRTFARRTVLALLVLGTFVAGVANAGPVEESAVRRAVTEQIVELADFYQALSQRAATDLVLRRIAFNPRREVALAGGIGREIAWTLAFRPEASIQRLADVHSPDRDLDVLYLGAADGDDEAHVLTILREVLEDVLARHGTVVLRIDAHSIREKQEEHPLDRQGYDTVSQALVTPDAILDLAVLLKLDGSAPADGPSGARSALLDPKIVYRLPHGPLEAPAEFLHQFVQVLRLCKIAAEFPKAPIVEETRANLRRILEAYRERRPALEAYLKEASEGGNHYLSNRLKDVFSALLRIDGGGALYRELDQEFGLSQFAPLRALVLNAAVIRRTVPLVSTGEPRSADLARLLAPGDRYPMGNGFFFDPTVRAIVKVDGIGEKPVSLSFRTDGDTIEAVAYSGVRGPVAPELLPIDRWEILRVRRYKGASWIVIARHRWSDYHVAGFLDTRARRKPEILFLNGRSFTAEASNGARAGEQGPMIGMLDVSVHRKGLVGYAANRVFSLLTLSQGSFKFSPFPLSAPHRSRVASFEVEGDLVYFLAQDGQLFALREGGPAELLFENVLGITRGEQGLLAYVEELPAKTRALYVFDRGALGYRRLPFPAPQADAPPVGLAGNDGASVLRQRYADGPRTLAETPELAYLRRPEAELLEAAHALAASLPQTMLVQGLLAEVLAAKQRPENLTDESRPGFEPRTGLLTKFRNAVLEANNSPETRAALGELFLLRTLLELRRGRTPTFPFSPNTWVLARLFALTAEFASPRTRPILRELAVSETIDELLFREPTPGGAPNGSLDPKAIFFVKQNAATLFAPTCDDMVVKGP
jgi:hypothetical protein